MQGAKIRVDNLHKTFALGARSVSVLHGVTLCIEAGERVAVLGASGAGKSTLLHLLGGLDAPTSGKVWIDGQDLYQMSPAALARFRNGRVGFVFQFHHLLPEFTALENVAIPARIAGASADEARQRAQALLDRVGVQHRLDHLPSELSGGEQQRVAIARALVQRPALLLADEPTGNLDTQTGASIHRLLDELNQEMGMTLVVVTHNEHFAMHLPRKLWMQDGLLQPHKIEQN